MLEAPRKGVDDYDWNAIYDSDGDLAGCCTPSAVATVLRLPAVLLQLLLVQHSKVMNSIGDGSTVESTDRNVQPELVSEQMRVKPSSTVEQSTVEHSSSVR